MSHYTVRKNGYSSNWSNDRSSPPEVFLEEGVLKVCSKFTEEHPCRSVILIKLQSNFIEIALRHGCFSVNLLHIFTTPFPKNTTAGLLLIIATLIWLKNLMEEFLVTLLWKITNLMMTLIKTLSYRPKITTLVLLKKVKKPAEYLTKHHLNFSQ